MAGWQEQKRFLDFFQKHGITFANLVTILPRPGQDPLVKGLARARDRAEVEKSFGWAWAENRRGAEVYIRPARWLPDGTPAAWPMVFLDDVTPARAAKIAGEFSAAVIETSPGLCHVWLPVSRPLDEAERKALQQRLIGVHSADKGSSSGEHLGRLAGFKNNKRGGNYVKITTTSSGRLYPAGDLVPLPPAAGADDGGACASQPAAGSIDMYESLGGWSSESERDFGYVIGRLRWLSENNPSQVNEEAARLEKELTEKAGARGKRNPKDYAKRTVKEALRRIGTLKAA